MTALYMQKRRSLQYLEKDLLLVLVLEASEGSLAEKVCEMGGCDWAGLEADDPAQHQGALQGGSYPGS